jgi:hypothetical protein
LPSSKSVTCCTRSSRSLRPWTSIPIGRQPRNGLHLRRANPEV